MSTHTQGKLTHKRLGVIVGGPFVEFARGSGQKQLAIVCGVDDGSEIEDNARRLVACWNACEGVPTDALEQIEGFGKAALPYHELKAQRDELIAVSKGLLEVYGIDDVRQWMALREKARAAIARAEVKP